MTAAAPWSVKGIDPKAREVAKELARRSGMTLGEWLNRVILEDDMPEDVTSEEHFNARPLRAAVEPVKSYMPSPSFTAKPDELGRRTPRVEQLRILGPGFLVSFELPSPVIDVHQPIECAR